MKKIPTLFKRDFTKKGRITNEYDSRVEWIVNGEGTATRKYDGSSALVRHGKLYKRYELKPGNMAPSDFELIDSDEKTGKKIGWVQVGWGNDDKWFREAIPGGNPDKVNLPDGTYELIGPKVQGNPEQLDLHQLFPHANAETYENVPTDYDGLEEWLIDKDIEGLVWHHPDGRMAKIKKKDFGLKR